MSLLSAAAHESPFGPFRTFRNVRYSALSGANRTLSTPHPASSIYEYTP
jgi:hypothetical protein